MSNSPKILLIYTGGTIGMIKDAETGSLSNVNFSLIKDEVPELKRFNLEIETISFEKPIDSSAIRTTDWVNIAQLIESNYANFDGFVVLHGTDTMAYSASALSFMFDGLKKPVIFTGAQLPIGVIRTDGKENLITAIEIAAAKDQNDEPIIQEVALYFDYKLFRGNRASKDSAEHFEAFKSPNFVELCDAGIALKFNPEKFYRTEKDELILKTDINTNVALIKLYPGINFELFAGIFDTTKTDGIVIETYGSGNAPYSGTFKKLLTNYIENGGVVLNITQCNSGGVQQGLYATSSLFNKLGVISGYDMTTEAAITKMMVVT